MPFCSYIHVDTSHKYSLIQDNQISIGMIQTQYVEYICKTSNQVAISKCFFIAQKKLNLHFMCNMSRDATRNPEDPIPRGPGHFFTPQFPEE